MWVTFELFSAGIKNQSNVDLEPDIIFYITDSYHVSSETASC